MKKYSSKRSVQLLASCLRENGIRDIVISPGSRNAPLAIQFAGEDFFNTYSIVDERSAGFTALGMSLASGLPSVVTCTSGSAAANYYPAVTEAFYQNIPLLLITADRPSDYTDIFDGQTIRQENIFSQHAYGSFQLLEDEQEGAEEANRRYIKDAICLCYEKRGPVHINIPLNEPLYELTNEKFSFRDLQVQKTSQVSEISPSDAGVWNSSRRILILVGSRPYSSKLNAQLSQLAKNNTAVILCEAGSNLTNERFFHHIDRYIFNFTEEEYKKFSPDLLITIGQNVVSKKVKQFLRNAQPKEHWHIDPHWHPDTYFSLTKKIIAEPEDYLSNILPKLHLEPHPYYMSWDVLRNKADAAHNAYLATVPFSDFKTVGLLPEYVPEKYAIHFSNSSAIRYAQLFDFSSYPIYCNRGTSGIDGCTSTAMGFSIRSSSPTLLVTGDISFFYDINGLWNEYIPPYTRIIILNNHEGNIFRIIPGPRNAQENVLEEFITTKHRHTAEWISKHFGWQYSLAQDELELVRILERFFEPSDKPRILEVDTSASDNAKILRTYFTPSAE